MLVHFALTICNSLLFSSASKCDEGMDDVVRNWDESKHVFSNWKTTSIQHISIYEGILWCHFTEYAWYRREYSSRGPARTTIMKYITLGGSFLFGHKLDSVDTIWYAQLMLPWTNNIRTLTSCAMGFNFKYFDKDTFGYFLELTGLLGCSK